MEDLKLVLAIVQARDADPLLEGLVREGFRATRVDSFGGFLRRGNAVVLVVVEDRHVDRVLTTIESRCRTRVELWYPLVGEPHLSTSAVEVEVGGAVVFVLPVERAHKLKGNTGGQRLAATQGGNRR